MQAAPLAAEAPEWVHLMPSGAISGRDGRSYTVSNPDALVAAFHARGVDLPIDYEHQSETHKETRVGPVPVAGWIKDMKARADGIWGRVEWTAAARDLISQKAYRYLSPVMMHRKDDKEVLRLKGAGLVHHPNLTLTALASQEDTMDDTRPFMHKIAKRLGLADGASEDEIMQTLEDALGKTPDPEKYVPIAAMQSLMDDRAQTATAMSESRALAKVEDALEKGHITPGMKDWATSLCRQNEASFDAFLERSGKVFSKLLEPTHTTAHPPSVQTSTARAESEMAVSICRQLGLEETALNS
ncbi:conserved hypothetical protein [Roseobacter denitrificans OCh 114]|uniref:Mu-like prophage I protein n=1 Tax=Roseobacter denitrificans (strain ATCC 33942 / OCh 114) TaxID=375451 RepID=Q16D75_ROSDO|nr:conserved hypothetical protein [Roseobacter denitrificans OCh 114]